MLNLVRFHAALADETRLRLLSLMQGREVCVCHFQEVLQTNQPKISRHLAYLKKAGLVVARRDGKWTYYKIKSQNSEVNELLAQSLAQYAKQPIVHKDAKRFEMVLRSHSKGICKD